MLLPDDHVAVKICGLTHPEDALAAVSAGADLLGFNTWPGTKRFIDLEKNAAWIAPLPARKIALLVNASLDDAACVASLSFIDALQLHGDEGADYCRQVALLGKPIIKAMRVSTEEDFAGAESYSTPHVLLDARVAGAYGGTGTEIDLALGAAFRRKHPQLRLWLAGGLNPQNVAAAIARTRPQVVDVSSGVESAPGRKDAGKMQAFIAAARAA